MRLIDADALKAYIDAQIGRPFIGCTVGEAMKILVDEQPTVEAEPHWIPCSERLPEKVGVYLVTDHKGDVVRYVFFDSETSKDYWKRCATAWMPVPEPYKGETDD